ncbi:MAG TPA: hypothetical protein VGM88_30175 [Kofleriaceae bacterium]|jgi:3-hydroxyacyl-[acyl-carrier-protein] dehydratase
MSELSLGPDVVQRLIPHRPPLLMVDRVHAFVGGARPSLVASRFISANEPVFAGHFPGMSLWPGVYTIEGLGQSTLLCAVLAHLVMAHGEPVLDSLRGLERAASRVTAPPKDELLASLGSPDARAGVAAHVDVKLLAPVFAGCELRYRVEQTHVVDALARFSVVAEVGGVPVARGTMTGAIGAGVRTA